MQLRGGDLCASCKVIALTPFSGSPPQVLHLTQQFRKGTSLNVISNMLLTSFSLTCGLDILDTARIQHETQSVVMDTKMLHLRMFVDTTIAELMALIAACLIRFT